MIRNQLFSNCISISKQLIKNIYVIVDEGSIIMFCVLKIVKRGIVFDQSRD